MRRESRPGPAGGGCLLYVYVALAVACSLAAGCGPAGGRQVAPRDLAAGRSPTAAAPPATPTPQPAPSPTPAPAAAPPPAAGPPTRIVAPAIGLDAPVVEIGFETTYLGDVPVTAWKEPANAAGFHKGAAYPGHAGNCVVSGHNNIQGEVFRHVAELEAGDQVLLYAGESVYRYVVASKDLLPEKGMPAEVRIANGRAILPTADERLTLVTCWPYSGNSHRVIITARPLR